MELLKKEPRRREDPHPGPAAGCHSNAPALPNPARASFCKGEVGGTESSYYETRLKQFWPSDLPPGGQERFSPPPLSWGEARYYIHPFSFLHRPTKRGSRRPLLRFSRDFPTAKLLLPFRRPPPRLGLIWPLGERARLLRAEASPSVGRLGGSFLPLGGCAARSLTGVVVLAALYER